MAVDEHQTILSHGFFPSQSVISLLTKLDKKHFLKIVCFKAHVLLQYANSCMSERSGLGRVFCHLSEFSMCDTSADRLTVNGCAVQQTFIKM